MKCDTCDGPRDKYYGKDYYLLLKGTTCGIYEALYNGGYENQHASHENAIHDLFMCVTCYHKFIDNFVNSDVSKLRNHYLPKHIPMNQCKRYMLRIFRGKDDKNRFKR